MTNILLSCYNIFQNLLLSHLELQYMMERTEENIRVWNDKINHPKNSGDPDVYLPRNCRYFAEEIKEIITGFPSKLNETYDTCAKIIGDMNKLIEKINGHSGIDQQFSQEDIFRGVNFDEIFRGSGFGVGGFDSIFDMFFGHQGRWHRGPQKGADLEYNLEVTLEDVASGLESEIYVPRRETCETCKGSGAAPGTEPRKCSRCKGTGQIQRSSSTGFGQFIQIQTCSLCNGKGTIMKLGDSPVENIPFILRAP
jgi:hypothetical protein